jgi:hypothetical protein
MDINIFNPENYQLFEKLGIVSLLMFIIINGFLYFKSLVKDIQGRLDNAIAKQEELQKIMLELSLKAEENESKLLDFITKQ